MRRPGVDTIETGIYWHREVYDLVRSAYVADLDAEPGGSEFFVEWLRRALEEHSALRPEERAARAADLPELAAGRGFSQMYPLPGDLLDQVEQGTVEDRKQLGKATSRSGFAREAVLVAVGEVRRRRGGTLPPPPSQLPYRRPGDTADLAWVAPLEVLGELLCRRREHEAASRCLLAGGGRVPADLDRRRCDGAEGQYAR